MTVAQLVQRTQASGVHGRLNLNPGNGYTWAKYFSEDRCNELDYDQEKEVKKGLRELKKNELENQLEGGTHLRAVNRAFAKFVTASRASKPAKWAAMVRYLYDLSRLRDSDPVWTNADVEIITSTDVSQATMERIRRRAFPL